MRLLVLLFVQMKAELRDATTYLEETRHGLQATDQTEIDTILER